MLACPIHEQRERASGNYAAQENSDHVHIPPHGTLADTVVAYIQAA